MLGSQLQPILAASSFEDWFKILFLILVFGGPIIGSVTKKLIAHFSPKEEENTPAKPQSPQPPIRRRAPSAPVARPMTSPQSQASGERLSPNRPQGDSLTPQRPVAGYPKPDIPARTTPPAVRPTAPKPTPRPTSQVPADKARSRRRPVENKSSARSHKASRPSKKSKGKHQHGVLIDLHEGGEALVDDLAMPVEKLSHRKRLLGSRASVRDAIMLSEILAPPLAMRESSNLPSL